MGSSLISLEEKIRKNLKDYKELLKDLEQFQRKALKRLKATERRFEVMRILQQQSNQQRQRKFYSFLPRSGAVPIKIKDEKGKLGDEEEQLVSISPQRNEQSTILSLKEGYSLCAITFATVYFLLHLLRNFNCM